LTLKRINIALDLFIEEASGGVTWDTFEQLLVKWIFIYVDWIR